PVRARLIVFPALELTFSVPCQAIMILDADFPENRLDVRIGMKPPRTRTNGNKKAAASVAA
ncbi:MAG: hypothetical protein JWP83_1058, partial [Mycobacterium sp.]|uniref:hypothetical protein n=1 Tax=Mycobacterium sp. TaxID=1785 RepID=UPI00261674E9